MDIHIHLEKKHLYFFSVFLLLFGGLLFVHGQATVPNPGHDADSVLITSLDKTLEQAIDEGDIPIGVSIPYLYGETFPLDEGDNFLAMAFRETTPGDGKLFFGFYATNTLKFDTLTVKILGSGRFPDAPERQRLRYVRSRHITPAGSSGQSFVKVDDTTLTFDLEVGSHGDGLAVNLEGVDVDTQIELTMTQRSGSSSAWTRTFDEVTYGSHIAVADWGAVNDVFTFYLVR